MDNSIYERILNGELSFKVEDSCPVATKDIAVNLKNRKTAIDSAMYGPLNPSEPNTEYWGKIAEEWDVDVASAKKQLCGNCVMFIVTPQMKDCINSGVTGGERPDEWAAIDSAGQLGYCEAFDFKCAAKRTCRAWVVGGPITEEQEKQVEEKAAKGGQENQISSWMNSMSDDEVDSLFPEEEEITDEEAKWMFGDEAESFKQTLTARRKVRGGYTSLNMGMEEKAAKKPVLRDPKGGLTAAGRAHFNKTEGSNLKPGVKGPADTPEKMRRKGSFLTRFFTNPRGPMKDEKGRPTRLALSAAAWGEPVPQTVEAAKKLADKGQSLLGRYRRYKESSKGKKSLESYDFVIKELGAPVGQQGGTVSSRGGGTVGGSSGQANYDPKARDADGDGTIQEGTDYARSTQEDDKKKRSRTWQTDSGSADTRERGIIRDNLESAGFDGEAFRKLIDAESRKLKPGQKTNWNPGRLPNGGKIAADGTYIPPDMVREDDKRISDYYRERREARANAPRPKITREGDVIPDKNRDRIPPKKTTTRSGSADSMERDAPRAPRGGSADAQERHAEAEERRRTGKGQGFDKLGTEEEVNAYRESYGLPPIKPKSPNGGRTGSADSQERTSSTSRRPNIQVPTTSDGTVIPDKNNDKRKPKGPSSLENFI